VETEAGSDDIDDRVDRADLVEVDALDGDPVAPRFSLAEPLEDGRGVYLDPLGQTADVDEREDLAQPALLGAALLVGMPVPVLVFVSVFVRMPVSVLVPVLVLVPVSVRMPVSVLVLVPVRTPVSVLVLVSRPVFVLVLVLVLVRMPVPVFVRVPAVAGMPLLAAGIALHDDLHARHLERAAKDLRSSQCPAVQTQAAESGIELLEGEARVDQRTQEHVSADAGERLKVGESRHLRQLFLVNAPKHKREGAKSQCNSGAARISPHKAPLPYGGGSGW
jgi:hypothetical protein